jgi:hypothetical protein
MPYDKPSIAAVDRSRPAPGGTRTILCPACGDTMEHLRTISKRGVRPEKLIFVCPSCKGVETKELIGTRRQGGGREQAA